MGGLTFSNASDEKVVTFKRVGTEAALRRELREHPPDLILSDYDLPGLDGISALRIARKLVPSTPFIGNLAVPYRSLPSTGQLLKCSAHFAGLP